MAHYLVRAEIRTDRRQELRDRLNNGEFKSLRPFGKALTYSLEHAKWDPETEQAVWEEEDYCTPPLAQERSAVLDHYFSNLTTEPVSEGEGWERIRNLPMLWIG